MPKVTPSQSLSGSALGSALVTGAGRGIGQAIARALMRRGGMIGLVVRRRTAAVEDLVAECDEAQAQAVVIEVDLLDAAAVEEKVGAFCALHPPDILVNNAGVTHDALALRVKDEDFRRVWELDFLAAARLARLCLRGMIKRRYGRVVQISSIVARHGNAGQAAYAAAKAALEAHTRSVAREVAERNVTVNAVAPGFIATDMTAGLNPEWKRAIEKEIPLRRFGLAEEVAEVVRFLASPEASYITGQVVDVTGGLLV